jgi:hypothetical protein
MYECPVCFDNIQQDEQKYFSCEKHSTCINCYFKCHVAEQVYLLRCPICRAQHYIEDRIERNPNDQWVTQLYSQRQNTIDQVHSCVWRDICNTLIIHISSIIIIIIGLKISQYFTSNSVTFD